jgi:thiol-disulfide isomerase/thioredoxin
MAYVFEGDRTAFLTLLSKNPGLLIFKFTADWCKPCQTIKNEVDTHFKSITNDDRLCYEIDIDECFDLFAFMKTKKMMKGIPTLLAYKRGNNSYVADDCISGADINEINAFFDRCKKIL